MTVIGIYGKSCTGKSSVVRKMAEICGLVDLRQCGDLFREASVRCGVPPGDLPLEVHRDIDRGTARFAEEAHIGRLLVIDGVFLHYVLSEVPGVNLVELRCPDEVRDTRHAGRARGDLRGERDSSDAALVSKLYGHPPTTPSQVFETSRRSIESLAVEILAWAKSVGFDD